MRHAPNQRPRPPQALLLAGHNVVAELEDGVLADEAEALRQKSKAARAKGAAQGGVGGSSSSTTAGQGGNGAKGGREARRSSTQGRGGAVEGAAGGAGGSAFTGYAGLGEQAEDESPVLPLLHSLQRSDTRVMRMGSVPAGAGPGWQAKLLQRQALQVGTVVGAGGVVGWGCGGDGVVYGKGDEHHPRMAG